MPARTTVLPPARPSAAPYALGDAQVAPTATLLAWERQGRHRYYRLL